MIIVVLIAVLVVIVTIAVLHLGHVQRRAGAAEAAADLPYDVILHIYITLYTIYNVMLYSSLFYYIYILL